MRYPLLRLLAFGGLLLSDRVALAQTTTPAYDPTIVHRAVQALEIVPELQGEFALRNGGYVLVALRGERSTADNTGRSLGFDTRRLWLGYEHFWNTRWSWGATARYESNARFETNNGGDLLTPELLLRHRSPIFGGLTFGQRLGVERQIPVNRHLASGPSGEFWGRLRVDVERLFSLSNATRGLALRPRLSYEASTHLRFQKEVTDRDERTIQFTSLRAEAGVRLSPQFDFTPWFAYRTVYRQDVVFTDITGTIPVSGGKINAVYPTVGLDIRFTILPTGTKTDRQQLPTQH